jgi:hypothetical protein
MEELTDLLKHIKNYADLSADDKRLALEVMYHRQMHSSHGTSIQDNQMMWSDVNEKEKDRGGDDGGEVAQDGKEGAHRVEEKRFKGKHRSIRDW